jgi:hypothetical protein
MALTDQPYLPLYVDDWMNNNKLKICSPGAHGLMISIMCLMHKSENYGIILLKQKFKQSIKQEENFASQIAKLTSFDLLDTTKYFAELIDEKVLRIDGETLVCDRMVKDANTSKKRAFSGKTGGTKTQNKHKNFALANTEANTVNVNGIVNEDDYVVEEGKEGTGEKPKKFNYKNSMLALVSDTVLVDDYIALRKLKRASLSETAFNLLVNECTENNFDLAEALTISIKKNWQGFKVEWVLNDIKNNATSTPETKTGYKFDLNRAIESSSSGGNQ